MAVTVSEKFRSTIAGRRITLHNVTFDDTYATGGEALAANDLGLQVVEGAVCAPVSGYVFEYDISNAKILAYNAGGAFTSGTIKQVMVAGAVAGDVTVSGIATGDTLISVLDVAGADLTSEFSITEADTINNACGTSSNGSFLIVTYEDASVDVGEAGAEVAAGTDLALVTVPVLAFGI